jgi:molecular chaperone HscB
MNLTDDDFTLFGLPQRFALDPAQLDERWRALQAQVHPDRFVAQGSAAQRVAMQWAVRVNEAYRRLKDPLARGAYLAGLRGASVDMHSNTAMPAEFLAQQMQWREALEEAPDVAAIEGLDREVAHMQREWLGELEAALDKRADPADAARRVRALMFLTRFRDDIDRRLEALGA